MKTSTSLTTTLKPDAVQAPAQADNDDHLIDLWLNSKRSAATRAEYARDVESFRAFVGYQSLPALRLGEVQSYAAEIERAGLAVNTRKRRLASVKSLLAFGHKVGYLAFDIGRAMSLPEAKNTLAARILTVEDTFRLIDREENPRNRLLLTLAYASGGRVSELVGLTWADLQPRESGGQATLFGKGQKTRAVLIPPKLWADLCELRAAAPTSAPVFPSRKGKGHLTRQQAFRIVKASARRIGLPAVSPHWMRHAHASHALDQGASLALVGETLGHSDLKTTSRYTHARPGASSSLYLAVG